MNKNLIKLSKNSFFYLISNFFSVFLGMAFLPIYTSYLTPNEYGITAIASSISVLFTAIFSLGLIDSFKRFYFDYRGDEKAFKQYISTLVFFVLMFGLLSILLIINSRGIVENYIKGIPFYPYVLMSILQSYFLVFFQIRLAFFQNEQKSKKYAFFYIASVIMQNVLILLLVVVQRLGAFGYILAGMISNFVLAVVSVWMLRAYIISKFDLPKLIASLRYGLPLLPGLISSWLLISADRFILNYLVDSSEVGIYSVGYKISMSMNLLVSSIGIAWMPYFYEMMKGTTENSKKEVARFITYWILVLCFSSLLLSIFSKEVIYIFAPSYYSAFKIVPLVVLGYLLGGFCTILINPLLWKGKTSIVTIATMLSGLLNIGLNFILIPRYLMTGSALSLVLSFLFYLIFIGYYSMKIMPLGYEYGRISKVLAVTILCYLMWYYLPENNIIWVGVLCKIIIIVMYFLVLLLTKFFGSEEKATINKYLMEKHSIWHKHMNLF